MAVATTTTRGSDMFTEITIRGLGPHDDAVLALSARGHTEIGGPSQAGKSLIIDAALFALTGCGADAKPLTVDAISDGQKRVSVQLTTAKGTVLRRAMTRGRRTRRQIGDVDHATESSFASTLGPIPHAAALILAPMSWVPLASGAGGGRAMRDLIAGLAPGDARGVVGALMEAAGHELRDDDSVTARAAEENRRQARRRLDVAAGQLAQAKQAADRDPAPDGPSAESIEQLRTEAAAAKEWRTYDERLAAYDAAADVRRAALERRAEWTRRREEIGEPSASDTALLDRRRKESAAAAHAAGVAAASLAASQAELFNAESAPIPEHRAVDAAEAALESARSGPGSCPTCGQQIGDRAEMISAAESELKRAKKTAKKRAEIAATARARKIADMQLAVKLARGTARAAAARADAKRAAYESAVRDDTLQAWRDDVAALGCEPDVPPASVAPTEPQCTRPAADVNARDLLARALQEAGAAEQQQRHAARAQSDLESAQSEHSAATEESDYYSALVEAVRSAPGEQLAAGIAALGDIGPVGFRVPDSGAIEVVVDGRLWNLASTGRLIYADAMLRAGLRRAMKMRWFPLAVDELQSWSGDRPPVSGPVWWIKTGGDRLSAAVR